MRRIAIALITSAALSVGFSQIATAADMPVKAPVYKAEPAVVTYSWTGGYIGVNAGYGWSVGDEGDLVAWDPTWNFAVNVFLNIPRQLQVRPDGFIGGGQLGYNWQSGVFVWGAEIDFQYSDIGGVSTIGINLPALGGAATRTVADSSLRWLGTARLRLGMTPAPRALIYVTGGAAYGKTKESVWWTTLPGGVTGNSYGSTSDTKFGWTAGAGGEWAFNENWTLRAEYLYVDLGNTTVRTNDLAFPGAFIQYAFGHQYHIARAALNYRFGAPY